MGHLETTELIAGLVRLGVGLTLGFLVYQLARRVAWPARGPRIGFFIIHLAAAPAAGLAWGIISIAIGTLSDTPVEMDLSDFVLIGVYIYLIVAGITYLVQAGARAARAESTAARMQLAALRAQIHPHFLFNALHTVVQLIPTDPARAAEAAEQLAELLRWTLEDDRDLILLREEWSFVSRYLDLERIRFGDRLRVVAEMDPGVMDIPVPSFTLQTLVENAVRHAAASRVEPTEIHISTDAVEGRLTLTVRNPVDTTPSGVRGPATGLRRLADRLAALYGDAARLSFGTQDGHFHAAVVVPHGKTFH